MPKCYQAFTNWLSIGVSYCISPFFFVMFFYIVINNGQYLTGVNVIAVMNINIF